jgi:fibronectin-binding autotransporter adhesin
VPIDGLARFRLIEIIPILRRRSAGNGGAAVSLDMSQSLKGRVGLTVDHQNDWQNASGSTRRTHLYGIVNLNYEFLDGTRTDVSGTRLANRDERLWTGLGLGGTLSMANGAYSLYTEASGDTAISDFGHSYNLKGTVGARLRF